MRAFLAILLVFVCSTSVSAQEYPRIVSAKASHVELTIYPEDLALVTETRQVNLPKGKSTLVFAGVNDQMIPSTVLLRQFSGLTLERNFDYAVLNKASLFASKLGQQVVVTRTNRASGTVSRKQATIISADDGVVFKIDGKYAAYQCSGLAENTRFEGLPEGLSNVPELSIDVNVETAGPQTVVISYLVEGISWEANYRLDLGATSKGTDLQGKLTGWLTITNETAQTFKGVPTAVVAGELNIGYNTEAPYIPEKMLKANCWPRQSTQFEFGNFYNFRGGVTAALQRNSGVAVARFSEVGTVNSEDDFADEIIVTGSRIKDEKLGDYKLYRTREPITVAAYQTKQIMFVSKPEVEVEKRYELGYDLDDGYDEELVPAGIQYRINNDKDGALATPMPKGYLMVFSKTQAGAPFFIGEGAVKNTPVGVVVKVNLDEETELVQVFSRMVGRLKKRKNRYRYAMEHSFLNSTDETILVEFYANNYVERENYEPEEDGEYSYEDAYSTITVTKPSIPLNRSEPPHTWVFPVAPNSTHTLKYRASYID